MNLQWMIMRLKAMSVREVLGRTVKKTLFLRARLSTDPYRRFKKNNGNRGTSPLPLSCDFPPHMQHSILNLSDGILEGTLPLLNQKIRIGTDFDFNTDPFTGKVWPRDFFEDVDYRAEDSPGDPKIIWEINRQQYLVPCALAFRFTGREAYRDFILDSILRWIDSNPPLRGINWASSMECGIRIVSWVFALNLLGAEAPTVKPHMNRIRDSVIDQACFVERNLSLYSSANNHLIGELTGLLAAAAFVNCSSAAVWEEKAVRLLNEQIGCQFFDDGVSREQAINYQCHTMDYYALCQYFLGIKGRRLEQKTLELLTRAQGFLSQITRDGMSPANIGDDDNGLVLPIINEEQRILYSLQFTSVITGREQCFNKDRDVDPRIYLLYGQAVAERFPEQKDTTGLESGKWHIYPHGGYGVIHRQMASLVFDFGPVGMTPLCAHGHADLLSILLSINGSGYLVDPGTYKYYHAGQWREYFKGTRAHNTVCVEKENQLTSLGRFLWGKIPSVAFLSESDSRITARHDGYNAKYGIIHKRTVEQSEQGFLIKDALERTKQGGKTEFTIGFHLHPSVSVRREGDNILTLCGEQGEITLLIDERLRIELLKGITEPSPLGWYSEGHYLLQPAVLIRCAGIVEEAADAEFRTEICIGNTARGEERC